VFLGLTISLVSYTDGQTDMAISTQLVANKLNITITVAQSPTTASTYPTQTRKDGPNRTRKEINKKQINFLQKN